MAPGLLLAISESGRIELYLWGIMAVTAFICAFFGFGIARNHKGLIIIASAILLLPIVFEVWWWPQSSLSVLVRIIYTI